MVSVKDIKVFKPSQEQIKQAQSWPIWECEKSVFDWDYTQSETCLILTGKVTVKDRPRDAEVSFGVGDMVVFPDELSCTWQVDEAVKKHYKFD